MRVFSYHLDYIQVYVEDYKKLSSKYNNHFNFKNNIKKQPYIFIHLLFISLRIKLIDFSLYLFSKSLFTFCLPNFNLISSSPTSKIILQFFQSLPLATYNQTRNHRSSSMKSKDQMCLLGLMGVNNHNHHHHHQQQHQAILGQGPPPFSKFTSVPNYPFAQNHPMTPVTHYLGQEPSLWSNKTPGESIQSGSVHHTKGVGLLATFAPKGHHPAPAWVSSGSSMHHGEITSPASTPGSFHVSPMMQQSSSPSCGTPHPNSPCMETVMQPAGMRKHNNPLSGGETRNMSPQRPKSFEQKLLTMSRQLSQGSMTQDFQQAQNGARPKSESEKEKVWKQKPERYKTELCRAFEDHNWCKYGSRCQFAHGMPELRQVDKHPKYKTQLCNAYHSTGYCKYGTRCHFIHNVDEGRVKNPTQAASSSQASKMSSRALQNGEKLEKKLSHSINNQTQVVSSSGDSNPGSQNEAPVPQLFANQKQTSNGASPKHIITPVGTPVKSDLSPHDITKEHFVGSSLLSKEAIASIWLPENQSCYSTNCGANNNIVFNFLPKNLLEL